MVQLAIVFNKRLHVVFFVLHVSAVQSLAQSVPLGPRRQMSGSQAAYEEAAPVWMSIARWLPSSAVADALVACDVTSVRSCEPRPMAQTDFPFCSCSCSFRHAKATLQPAVIYP